MDYDANRISEVTRRELFDALTIGDYAWAGRMSESRFLDRTFDLASVRSHDYRCPNMLREVVLHREQFDDWGRHWIYDDGRLNLARCPDGTLLKLLCEMIHPLVRVSEEEVDELVTLFNSFLIRDGFRIEVDEVRSGRRVFRGMEASISVSGRLSEAKRVAETLRSRHVMDQITRMEAAALRDPSLAIGSAKEFVESICKAILAERGVKLTGHEPLPKLVQEARGSIGLSVTPEADGSIRSVLGALATLTHGLSELRGRLGTGHGAHPGTAQPPPEVAKLLVGMATTLAVFLWESHMAMAAEDRDTKRDLSPIA